jgi:ABC-2 type transport system permease protein
MADRYSPLAQLTLARVREFVREPEAMFWVFAFPLLLAVALGLAFRDKAPDRIPAGIVESGNPGGAARATAAVLARSPVLLPRLMTPAAGRDALRTGKISLLVEIEGDRPPAATVPRSPSPPPPSPPPVVFRFDPTRPDARIASLAAEDALQRAAGRRDVVATRSEEVTEHGSRYIDFLIPGLLGMNLMGTGVWSLAFSITTARQKQLLKRLIATPMRRSHYLLAQILGRLVFLVPELVVLVGVGWLAFGVAVRGSLGLLAITSLLGAVTFCGLGLLVSSRVRTIEGASGLANFVMMPMWLVSGVFFSSERFPDRLQPLIRALPLTALNDALRGIMNEGRPLSGVGTQLLILSAWGILSFLLALRIFRWR